MFRSNAKKRNSIRFFRQFGRKGHKVWRTKFPRQKRLVRSGGSNLDWQIDGRRWPGEGSRRWSSCKQSTTSILANSFFSRGGGIPISPLSVRIAKRSLNLIFKNQRIRIVLKVCHPWALISVIQFHLSQMRIDLVHTCTRSGPLEGGSKNF